eukprot:jgi/Ulvmu1/4782/UM020_0067.1
MLRFRGSSYLRLRLVLSCLTGRPVRIEQIRADDEAPGLRTFEASFLRLVEKVSNGCVVEINETGTELRFRPGVVVGGSDFAHDCGKERSIGYFLEPLCLLCLFSKQSLDITLEGYTNAPLDESIDSFRAATLPLLKACGVTATVSTRQRAVPPEGRAAVHVTVEALRSIEQPVRLTEEGLVRRVRGVAWTVNMGPQNAKAAFSAAKGVLLKLLADVQIFTDVVSIKPKPGHPRCAPGYGILVVAETTAGRYLSAERCVCGTELLRCKEEEITASDIGQQAACMLLDEIQRGGVVDGSHQALALVLAALGPQELNRVRLGPITEPAVHALRHLKAFLGVEFDVKTDEESQTVNLTCIGAGVHNTSRKVQ